MASSAVCGGRSEPPAPRSPRFPRHRLLPQPGGFEGISAMAEELQPAELSISDREDLKEVDHDRDAAFRPLPLWRMKTRTRSSGASMNSSGSRASSSQVLRYCSVKVMTSAMPRRCCGASGYVRWSCQSTSICGSRCSAWASLDSSSRMKALNASAHRSASSWTFPSDIARAVSPGGVSEAAADRQLRDRVTGIGTVECPPLTRK